VKVLYVSQYFPPEMGAPAARASELSAHWTRKGHEVTVLTGFPNHPTGIVPANYRARMRRLISRETLEGTNVVRTWLLAYPNRKAYERMLNYSSFALSATITGCFVDKPDVVIGSSPQLLVGLAAWAIAQRHQAPFVFEVRDLWPESLAAVGMAGSNSHLYRWLSGIARFLYNHADHIVAVSPAFEDHLVSNWRLPRHKISIVPNGVETKLFEPTARPTNLLRSLQADGRFVVSYIGNMGMAHGLETLLTAASELQESAPDVLFLLVGEGADTDRILSSIANQGLRNVRFVAQQPRETIPAYIAASDACLVLLRKADLFHTVIPSKMLEFMACERPIIVGVDGQARNIMEVAHAGIYVEPENPHALASAILELKANPMLREALGRNGRRYILQYFSRGTTAANYIRVLENVTGKTEKTHAAVA
jgi:colanic acid biosynthesis glycosyl transferase WcaI